MIVAGLLLPVVLGFAALSVEYGHGLLIRVENQRTADVASYAGALVYSETNSETEMVAAARSAAALNGVAAKDVAVALVTSPRDPNGKAVHATVTTVKPLYLAPILGIEPELPVTADAYASIEAAKGGCIVALDESSSGITLQGGVKINAAPCNVASNAGIKAPCGTRITAESATYYSRTPEPCRWSDNIVKADGSAAPVTKQYTDDPLKDHSGVASLDARFEVIRKASWPRAVSVPAGTDIKFGWGPLPANERQALAASSCTATRRSSRWVVTCTGPQVDLGSISSGDGIAVEFNISGSPDTIYNFSGAIRTGGGGSLAFGPGTYNIAKGVYGASLSFGAGSFHIGKSETNICGAFYSVCSSGTVTFDGPSTFVLDAGFRTVGGATLTLGSGDSNSYVIGASSTGAAITLGGGSKAFMADAIRGGGVFRVNGDIDGGGGSCIEFPASAQHDISGNVQLDGGARLGAGIYTVDGYFMVDTGGANCAGSNAVYGEDVTIVISGIETPSGWACRGQAFCLDGGNRITLTAPTSGPYAKLAVIGPQAPDITAGATITSGGQGAVSGAFYFPNGPIELGGGGRIGGGSADCLQFIGASISMSGGAQTLSECIAAGGSGKVALIQ